MFIARAVPSSVAYGSPHWVKCSFPQLEPGSEAEILHRQAYGELEDDRDPFFNACDSLVLYVETLMCHQPSRAPMKSNTMLNQSFGL